MTTILKNLAITSAASMVAALFVPAAIAAAGAFISGMIVTAATVWALRATSE